MPRHIQQPEFGPEAVGPGSLQWTTLPTVGNPVIWDFEAKSTGNAKLELQTSLNLNIINMPDGSQANLFVTMGPTGGELLSFSGTVSRYGETSRLLDNTPGSITLLKIIKNGATLGISSQFIGQFSSTFPGLVPATAGTTFGDVLLRSGWGKITPESTSSDFNSYYLDRKNHIGFQPSTSISDFTEAVRANPINLLSNPTGNLNMNMKRIVNLSDPIDDYDAVNAIYVSDAITSDQSLLFIQFFS